MNKTRLEVVYIPIYVLLNILSSYILTASIIYTLHKLKDDLRNENIVVCVCSFCPFLCSILITVLNLKDLYNNNDKFYCTFVGISLITNITLSKVLCNIVFAYRYKTIHKSLNSLAARRAYIFTVLIIVLSIIGFLSNIYFWTYKVRQPCNYGRIDKSNYAFGFFILGTYIFGTFFQTVILVEIIKPLFNHYVSMSRTTIPTNQTKNLLCRVIVSTLNFCVTDFALLIYGFFKHKGTEFSLLVVLNLLINAISLMCSYTDYKKRLFPCLMWKNSNQQHIRSLHGMTKNNSSSEKNETSSSTLFKGKNIVKTLGQNNNENGFSSIVQSHLSSIKPVLHVRKSFKIPEIKHQIKSTNLVIYQAEISEIQSISAYKTPKPIHFVNERKTSTKGRKFLSFVPRRKNLKEFETTV